MKKLTIRWTVSTLPFEWQISAMVGALFGLNAHYGTAFFLLHEKNILLMGQHCPTCPLKVLQDWGNCYWIMQHITETVHCTPGLKCILECGILLKWMANLDLTVTHSQLIHICSVLLFLSGGMLMRVPTMNSVAPLAFPLKNLYMYCSCSLFNNAE
jgi:hypothetical protein